MIAFEVKMLKYGGYGPVSFTMRAGERIGVTGPSGCGKTRLLRALADLDPWQGEIRLEDMAPNLCARAHGVNGWPICRPRASGGSIAWDRISRIRQMRTICMLWGWPPMFCRGRCRASPAVRNSGLEYCERWRTTVLRCCCSMNRLRTWMPSARARMNLWLRDGVRTE